jgi:signal transduction histidine kinase/DNA-binding NarL/FixJ family response regulator
MVDPTKQLKILVLEDDEADRRLLQRALAKSSLSSCKVVYAGLLEEALQLLQKGTFDVVLSDLNVPDSHGIETLVRINEKHPDAAIIAVTGHSDEQVGRKAIAEGAQDYLVKGEYNDRTLTKSVEYAVQRKETGKRIKSQSEFLKNVLESLTHPFYVLDAEDYTIKMANSAAGQIDVSEKKLCCYTLYHNNDKPCVAPGHPCPLQEVKKTKKPAVVEHIHRDENGNPKYVELHAYPLFDDSGNVAQIIEYSLDITRRKQAEKEKEKAEAQLRQAQKMEAIGTLAGGIAHDFNNMLGAMLGYTNLAIQDVPEGTVAHRNLEEVLTAANRARELVKQILTFGREGEENMKPLRIASVVREATRTIKSSLPANIDVHENIKTTSSSILANVIHIHQILLNLCNNASHAMSEKGGVLKVGLVDIDIESDTIINNTHLKQGKYVRLSVSDTGSGMKQEVTERVFEPFFTTKEVGKGTGMGLSVVHGIVKKCNAIIGIESQEGKGTTFNIFFPRIQTENEKTAESSSDTLEDDNGLILLVDDEEIIVDVTTQTLERMGYKIIGKTSSLEALEIFREEPNRFDMVITDHRMPKLTGTQFAQKLIDIRADIPIVLCTGFSEDIGPEEAKKLGIREYMMKPVTGKQLAQTIETILKPEEVTT